jgi:hypothetical protein
MKYPADWLRCEGIGEYGDFELIFHKERAAAVGVRIANLSAKHGTLNTFMEWVDRWIYPEFQKPDWKIELSNNYTLSSIPAIAIFRTEDDGYKDMHFFIEENNTLYWVSYSGYDYEGYSEYLGTVEEMIDSFTITK